MTDLTRNNSNNQKKSCSTSSIKVDAADFGAVDEYLVLNLPANSIITAVITDIAVLDATALTSTFTVKSGGTAISAGKNFGSGGAVGTTVSTTGLPRKTGVGEAVTITVATAGITEAKGTFIIEYNEYEKTCGELTNITA